MEAKEVSQILKEAYNKMTPEEKMEQERRIKKMEQAGLFLLANDTEE